jgi:hypothetical protein
MKKGLLIALALVLLTGCSYEEMKMKKNNKKDCKKYETILSTTFGGGEGENSGLIEYGYCDGKLVSATLSQRSLLSKYTYNKVELNKVYYDQIKAGLPNAIVTTKTGERKEKDLTVT